MNLCLCRHPKDKNPQWLPNTVLSPLNFVIKQNIKSIQFMSLYDSLKATFKTSTSMLMSVVVNIFLITHLYTQDNLTKFVDDFTL